MNTVKMTIWLAGLLTLAAVMNPDPVHAACDYQLAGDLNNDCRVDLQDFAFLAAIASAGEKQYASAGRSRNGRSTSWARGPK